MNIESTSLTPVCPVSHTFFLPHFFVWTTVKLCVASHCLLISMTTLFISCHLCPFWLAISIWKLNNLLIDICKILNANAGNQGIAFTCKMIIQIVESMLIFFKIMLEMKTQDWKKKYVLAFRSLRICSMLFWKILM